MTTCLTPEHRLLRWFDRWRWLLLLCLVVMSLLAFNGKWRIRPDGVRFANAAQAIDQDKDLKQHTSVQIERGGMPTVFQWHLNQTSRHSFLVLQSGVFILGWVTLGFIFLTAWVYRGRAFAVAITFLAGVTENFFVTWYEQLSELPFTLGLMMTLLGWQLIRGRDVVWHQGWLRSTAIWRLYRKQKKDAPVMAAADGSVSSTADVRPDLDEIEAVCDQKRMADDALGPDSALPFLFMRWGLAVPLMLAGFTMMMAFRSVAVLVMGAFAGGLIVLWFKRVLVGPDRKVWALLGGGGLLAVVAAGGLARLLAYGRDGFMTLHHDERMGIGMLRELWQWIRYGETQSPAIQRLAGNPAQMFYEALPEGFFGTDPGDIAGPIISVIILITCLVLIWRKPFWSMLFIMIFSFQMFFWPVDRYFMPLTMIVLVGWWIGASVVSRGLAWLLGGGNLMRWTWVKRAMEQGRSPRLGVGGFVGGLYILFMVSVIFVGNMIANAELIIEQRQPEFYREFRRGKYHAHWQASVKMREQEKASAVIWLQRVQVDETTVERELQDEKTMCNLLYYLTDHSATLQQNPTDENPGVHVYWLCRLPAGMTGAQTRPEASGQWQIIGQFAGESGQVWVLWMREPLRNAMVDHVTTQSSEKADHE